MEERPWMTALEMQFAALRMAASRLAGGDDDNKNRVRRVAALKGAEAFAWSKETASAVRLASRSIPTDTRISKEGELWALPSWWWFGNALDLTPYAAGQQNFCAMLLNPTAGGIEITGLIPTDDDRKIPHAALSWFWRDSESLKDVGLTAVRECEQAAQKHPHLANLYASNGSVIIEASAFIVAAQAWLSQRIVTWSSGHIERHRRKQLAREHGTPIPSDVKVIQLRRGESQQHGKSDCSEPIEWSCRWLVNGHWRNQPYAGGERKLIYIMPYVKGPEDMPLKVPTHTVYQVSR